MKNTLKGRDFLSLHDFTPEEVKYLLDLADELKSDVKNGKEHKVLANKTLGMIFTKSSTRTRVSFEVGMYQLGGFPMFLSSNDLQLGRGEPIKDTARVLSRYLDGIMIRTFSHNDVIELAKYADIPIINGLTDLLHPCQALADIQTIREHKGKLAGIKLVYVGDANNVANSLIFAAAKTGMHIVIASPDGYKPSEDILSLALADAEATGAKIEVMSDIVKAVDGADVLYSDVWTSMGQESESAKRLKDLKDYQINSKIMQIANKDAIWMHCLPAHRGEEVTEEVLESNQSVIFDQAENRLHAQKAVMYSVM